jgi:RecJ-like exonuclease
MLTGAQNAVCKDCNGKGSQKEGATRKCTGCFGRGIRMWAPFVCDLFVHVHVTVPLPVPVPVPVAVTGPISIRLLASEWVSECERSITRQIGPGMIQQLQQMCPECQGQGEVINEKDRCKTCQGKKTVPESKVRSRVT